jgi:acetyl esterase/lipase
MRDEGWLNLYIFNPPGHKSTDKRPAIVFFFGGGWTSGTPAQFQHQCRYLEDFAQRRKDAKNFASFAPLREK